MKPLHWTTQLELQLTKPQSLRVLDKSSVARLARAVHPALSNPTIDRWIRESIAAGRLQRVVRGMYLNRFIHPAALPCEAVRATVAAYDHIHSIASGSQRRRYREAADERLEDPMQSCRLL